MIFSTTLLLYFLNQTSSLIVVMPDSAAVPISRQVFGSGDEMNACFSPLVQVQPLISATHPTLMRFGGIGAEYLDWEADTLAGIWYLDFVDTFIIPVQVNFGVDSFLRLCEDINAEPILTVNMQTADIYLAGRMVQYVNGDTATPMGRMRAQRGHPDPYDVKIWSLGNEPDIAGGQFPVPPFGYWTFYRHAFIPFLNWNWSDSVFWTPSAFAGLIPLYANEMQNASPLPLEFICSIAGTPSWVRPAIQPNINIIDYLDVHYYPYSAWDSLMDTASYIQALMRTDTIFPAEQYIQLFRDSLSAIGATSVKTVVLEYNCGIIMVPDMLWWNYLCGLFVADCIGHWLHAGLDMAAVYSIHEGSPGSTDFPYFGIVRGDTVSRRMPSHVLEMYSTYFGDTLVYSFSDHKNSGYGIECWASKRTADRKYALVVVNKTLDTTYSATLCVKDSLQSFHILSITNNAPIGAPYNGTTGIVDNGIFTPDSIKGDWTYLTYDFTDAGVFLLEAVPWQAISEQADARETNLSLPSMVKSGTVLKLTAGNYTLFSYDGRVIAEWQGTESIMVPAVPAGVYFLGMPGNEYRKIVVIK